MNFICYPNTTNAPFRGKSVPYDKQDAVGYWLKHYKISLVLTFLAQHSPDFNRRAVARAELDIAHRKMEHWYRHTNFDVTIASRATMIARRTPIEQLISELAA